MAITPVKAQTEKRRGRPPKATGKGNNKPMANKKGATGRTSETQSSSSGNGIDTSREDTQLLRLVRDAGITRDNVGLWNVIQANGPEIVSWYFERASTAGRIHDVAQMEQCRNIANQLSDYLGLPAQARAMGAAAGR